MSQSFVFVTGNLKKVHWLEKFLGQKVDHHELDLVEVQSLDSQEVVRYKAIEAYRLLKKPVLIEDTSLAFNALNGLPGSFIKFFLEQIGNDGICQMMSAYNDKSAVSSVIYGLYDGKTLHSFNAEITGTIRDKPKGSFGMGWDPIFIPDGYANTYAQMNEEEHAESSVRNKAVQKLAAFLKDGKNWGEL